jgi:hypothetical protein
MAELKTKPTEQSAEEFLNGISDEKKRNDSFSILEMMKAASKAEPKMWGSAIIGFGDTHYKYASGREGDWFKIGFSPRKEALTLYLHGGLELQAELLKRLGKYKTGKGCIYIKDLNDVDKQILKEMFERAVISFE